MKFKILRFMFLALKKTKFNSISKIFKQFCNVAIQHFYILINGDGKYERFKIPNEKKLRIIINTDAKNEVDDQFAIVQAVLSESFDIRAIIAAHFGEEKSKTSMLDSYDEINKVLSLMKMVQ